jgi:hypothetical protein
MKEVGSDDSIWANLGGHVVWGPVTCRDMSEYCKNGCVLSSCPCICVLSLDVWLGTDMNL